MRFLKKAPYDSEPSSNEGAGMNFVKKRSGLRRGMAPKRVGTPQGPKKIPESKTRGSQAPQLYDHSNLESSKLPSLAHRRFNNSSASKSGPPSRAPSSPRRRTEALAAKMSIAGRRKHLTLPKSNVASVSETEKSDKSIDTNAAAIPQPDAVNSERKPKILFLDCPTSPMQSNKSVDLWRALLDTSSTQVTGPETMHAESSRPTSEPRLSVTAPSTTSKIGDAQPSTASVEAKVAQASNTTSPSIIKTSLKSPVFSAGRYRQGKKYRVETEVDSNMWTDFDPSSPFESLESGLKRVLRPKLNVPQSESEDSSEAENAVESNPVVLQLAGKQSNSVTAKATGPNFTSVAQKKTAKATGPNFTSLAQKKQATAALDRISMGIIAKELDNEVVRIRRKTVTEGFRHIKLRVKYVSGVTVQHGGRRYRRKDQAEDLPSCVQGYIEIDSGSGIERTGAIYSEALAGALDCASFFVACIVWSSSVDSKDHDQDTLYLSIPWSQRIHRTKNIRLNIGLRRGEELLPLGFALLGKDEIEFDRKNFELGVRSLRSHTYPPKGLFKGRQKELGVHFIDDDKIYGLDKSAVIKIDIAVIDSKSSSTGPLVWDSNIADKDVTAKSTSHLVPKTLKSVHFSGVNAETVVRGKSSSSQAHDNGSSQLDQASSGQRGNPDTNQCPPSATERARKPLAAGSGSVSPQASSVNVTDTEKEGSCAPEGSFSPRAQLIRAPNGTSIQTRKKEPDWWCGGLSDWINNVGTDIENIETIFGYEEAQKEGPQQTSKSSSLISSAEGSAAKHGDESAHTASNQIHESMDMNQTEDNKKLSPIDENKISEMKSDDSYLIGRAEGETSNSNHEPLPLDEWLRIFCFDDDLTQTDDRKEGKNSGSTTDKRTCREQQDTKAFAKQKTGGGGWTVCGPLFGVSESVSTEYATQGLVSSNRSLDENDVEAEFGAEHTTLLLVQTVSSGHTDATQSTINKSVTKAKTSPLSGICMPSCNPLADDLLSGDDESVFLAADSSDSSSSHSTDNGDSAEKISDQVYPRGITLPAKLPLNDGKATLSEDDAEDKEDESTQVSFSNGLVCSAGFCSLGLRDTHRNDLGSFDLNEQRRTDGKESKNRKTGKRNAQNTIESREDSSHVRKSDVSSVVDREAAAGEQKNSLSTIEVTKPRSGHTSMAHVTENEREQHQATAVLSTVSSELFSLSQEESCKLQKASEDKEFLSSISKDSTTKGGKANKRSSSFLPKFRGASSKPPLQQNARKFRSDIGMEPSEASKVPKDGSMTALNNPSFSFSLAPSGSSRATEKKGPQQASTPNSFRAMESVADQVINILFPEVENTSSDEESTVVSESSSHHTEKVAATVKTSKMELRSGPSHDLSAGGIGGRNASHLSESEAYQDAARKIVSMAGKLGMEPHELLERIAQGEDVEQLMGPQKSEYLKSASE